MKTDYVSGIVLPMVLMVGLVLTAFIFSLIHTVLVYHKLVQQMEEKDMRFYQLETMANQLIKYGFKPACVLTEMDVNTVLQRVSDSNACVIDSENGPYRYLVADLGYYPCLRIEGDASHHWLFSVESPDAKRLQLRIAVAEKGKPCTDAVARVIGKGVLSWRYIE